MLFFLFRKLSLHAHVLSRMYWILMKTTLLLEPWCCITILSLVVRRAISSHRCVQVEPVRVCVCIKNCSWIATIVLLSAWSNFLCRLSCRAESSYSLVCSESIAYNILLMCWIRVLRGDCHVVLRIIRNLLTDIILSCAWPCEGLICKSKVKCLAILHFQSLLLHRENWNCKALSVSNIVFASRCCIVCTDSFVDGVFLHKGSHNASKVWIGASNHIRSLPHLLTTSSRCLSYTVSWLKIRRNKLLILFISLMIYYHRILIRRCLSSSRIVHIREAWKFGFSCTFSHLDFLLLGLLLLSTWLWNLVSYLDRGNSRFCFLHFFVLKWIFWFPCRLFFKNLREDCWCNCNCHFEIIICFCCLYSYSIWGWLMSLPISHSVVRWSLLDRLEFLWTSLIFTSPVDDIPVQAPSIYWSYLFRRARSRFQQNLINLPFVVQLIHWFVFICLWVFN